MRTADRTTRATALAVLAGLWTALSAPAQAPLFVDATPQDNFKLYWLIRADAPPAIDGKLDDAVWRKAKPLRDWGTTNYGRTRQGMGEDFIPGEIDFRAAWDETYLYIAARCYHRLHPNDVAELHRKIANVAEPIYARECLEIHIDGNLDHATRFQSIVNPLGEKMMIWHYDFGWGILQNTDYGMDADWDVAADIGQDSWTVEVRYALADIQIEPRVGAMFGMNPCWFDWADSRAGDGERYWWQYVTWSTHDDSHHDPRLYGRFILVDKEPATLEEGLRLAFPDLDKRSIMIQTDDGLLVMAQGKRTLRPYDAQARAETAAARALWNDVEALAGDNEAAGIGHFVQNVLPEQDAKLKEVEAALADADSLSRGAVAQARRSIAKIRRTLEDTKWRIKERVLLSGLANE
jgi:hypothetical protein